MTTPKEQREKNEARHSLMQELRDALEKMKARAPGAPAIAIPLDKVLTFKGKDGEVSGIIEVQEVIYLVDEILRDA